MKFEINNNIVSLMHNGVWYNGIIQGSNIMWNKSWGSFEVEFIYDGVTNNNAAFNDDNWEEVLGDDHLFVQLYNNVSTDVDVDGSSVTLIVDADELLNFLLQETIGVC